MQKTLTHYEQLNVARDASPEEIKRAFRKLAQQLHPDRNPAANASELMSLVNASHTVLADPAKRVLYDVQLAQEERRLLEASQQVATTRQGAAVYAAAAVRPAAGPSRAGAASATRSSGAAPAQAMDAGAKRRRWRSVMRWALLFMTFCAAGAWMGYDRDASLSFTPTEALPVQTWVKPAPVVAEPAAPVLPASAPEVVAEPGCVVPELDPTGAPWQAAAGYVQGMPVLKQTGWSQIVVDNSGGESAVYAKVTDAVGRNAYRHAYIPAGARFTFTRMDAGYYLLKYQMLKTGCAFASNRILLEETPMGSQVKSSVYRLTLSKLKDRGVSPAPLKPNQF